MYRLRGEGSLYIYRERGVGFAVRFLYGARVAPLFLNQKWFDPGCELGKSIRSLYNARKQILHADDVYLIKLQHGGRL
jgi:hypothetical protein